VGDGESTEEKWREQKQFFLFLAGYPTVLFVRATKVKSLGNIEQQDEIVVPFFSFFLLMTMVVTPHVSKPHDYVNHMFMRP
jgi:hypothetical protein